MSLMMRPPSVCAWDARTSQPARRPSPGGVPGRRGVCLGARTPPAVQEIDNCQLAIANCNAHVVYPSTTAAFSVVVHDRADAAALGEQRIAAVAEQVEIERL